MNLPSGINEFVKPDIDRKDFIQKYLLDIGVNSTVIVLDGKHHILVEFDKSGYNLRYKSKTLVAHYDRVNGTSGANDNSSGVFALLEACKRIKDFKGEHNTRVIFTDGEEDGRKGVSSQGAFSLAKKFRELNTDTGDVYVFDCVGRGEIPVIAEVEFNSKTERKFINEYSVLESHLKNFVLKNSISGFDNIVLPASFSDNAGFIANGIPAVCLTMLPKDEVVNYMSNLKRIAGLRESVMNRKLEDIPDKIKPEYVLRESIPLTWKYFHTQFDNITTLTPVSFSIVAKIIDDIIKINYFR